jgi:hypothetical protein
MNGMHVKKRNRFTSTYIPEICRLVAGLRCGISPTARIISIAISFSQNERQGKEGIGIGTALPCLAPVLRLLMHAHQLINK